MSSSATSTSQALTNPDLPPFVLLADPQAYQPCNVDLMEDAEARNYWIDFFCDHIDTILQLGIDSADDKADAKNRAEACAADLRRHLRHFQDKPGDFDGVTLLVMDVWRDEFLRKHGFGDCFAEQKQRENEAMLPLLGEVMDKLAKLTGREQWQRAIEGVFAGNIFDMGAKATAGKFKDSSPDFFKTLDEIKPRPWRIDDFDAFADRITTRPYEKVVYFIDNAGSDFLLGAIPLMHLMAEQGTHVVIAANETPSLNDMTIHDVRNWWARIVKAGGLVESKFGLISSGTGEPLIDLRGVSPELNTAAEGADLVVLEGMGRGVESNLDADLVCDRLNLAMLKDELIAKEVGGELYDCVCRFVARSR